MFIQKRELALRYFPESESPRVARERLMRQIRKCRELKEALDMTQHSSKSQCFSPREVKLIYEYLGEPLSIKD